MSGCERRYHDCDDAMLDRLNGVDNIQPVGQRNRNGSRYDDDAGILDPCGGCWSEGNVCRKKQRSCCEYCWLRSRCPYRDSVRN